MRVLLAILIAGCSTGQVHTNALIHEASPYLLQHAHNPVDWMPWGDAAFKKAESENKPVFLSIGYAACHWCHVMERESFENEEIARYLNEHFVSIKVDREERPEVDHHYMQAVQRLTGSGGWPMSVFLTADRKPFYGGTYWPPEAKYGRPGFQDILKRISEAWETDRASILTSSERIHELISTDAEIGDAVGSLSPALFDSAVAMSKRNFDPVNGGFSKAPKFPHAMELAMLLRYYARTGDDSVRHMVEFTLDKMARGGIFDQIGGGFHRYSTDEKWLVPHFEKMLYDNALLMGVYWDAGRLSPEMGFRDVAHSTAEFASTELKTSSGAYASSFDADSEGEEGKYYVWTPDEIDSVLGAEAAQFLEAFNITSGGNFENGASIPNRIKQAGPAKPDDDNFENQKRRLYSARQQRVAPHRDDKELCDWNGMMISALAQSGDVEQAQAAAERFWQPFDASGDLIHSFLGDKELRVQLLMDYAALGNGLFDLFCATGDVKWFDAAYKLAEEIEMRFARGDGLYYMSEDSVAGARPMDLYDSALPSGNSLAGNLFVKLYYLTGEEKFRERAEKQINALMPYLEKAPTAFSQALLTAEWLVYPPEQLIIVRPDHGEFWDAAMFGNPHRLTVIMKQRAVETLPDEHPLQALVGGKQTSDGKQTAYLCRNFACELPTANLNELKKALKRSWEK